MRKILELLFGSTEDVEMKEFVNSSIQNSADAYKEKVSQVSAFFNSSSGGFDADKYKKVMQEILEALKANNDLQLKNYYGILRRNLIKYRQTLLEAIDKNLHAFFPNIEKLKAVLASYKQVLDIPIYDQLINSENAVIRDTTKKLIAFIEKVNKDITSGDKQICIDYLKRLIPLLNQLNQYEASLCPIPSSLEELDKNIDFYEKNSAIKKAIEAFTTPVQNEYSQFELSFETINSFSDTQKTSLTDFLSATINNLSNTTDIKTFVRTILAIDKYNQLTSDIRSKINQRFELIKTNIRNNDPINLDELIQFCQMVKQLGNNSMREEVETCVTTYLDNELSSLLILKMKVYGSLSEEDNYHTLIAQLMRCLQKANYSNKSLKQLQIHIQKLWREREKKPVDATQETIALLKPCIQQELQDIRQNKLPTPVFAYERYSLLLFKIIQLEQNQETIKTPRSLSVDAYKNELLGKLKEVAFLYDPAWIDKVNQYIRVVDGRDIKAAVEWINQHIVDGEDVFSCTLYAAGVLNSAKEGRLDMSQTAINQRYRDLLSILKKTSQTYDSAEVNRFFKNIHYGNFPAAKANMATFLTDAKIQQRIELEKTAILRALSIDLLKSGINQNVLANDQTMLIKRYKALMNILTINDQIAFIQQCTKQVVEATTNIRSLRECLSYNKAFLKFLLPFIRLNQTLGSATIEDWANSQITQIQSNINEEQYTGVLAKIKQYSRIYPLLEDIEEGNFTSPTELKKNLNIVLRQKAAWINNAYFVVKNQSVNDFITIGVPLMTLIANLLKHDDSPNVTLNKCYEHLLSNLIKKRKELLLTLTQNIGNKKSLTDYSSILQLPIYDERANIDRNILDALTRV